MDKLKSIALCMLMAGSLLMLSQNSRAAAYYVAKTGNNASSGAIGSPFLTIAYGLSRLSAGDTLYVRGGTYAETFGPGGIPSGTSWSAPVTMTAYPNETVTIMPASGQYIFKLADTRYFIVNGFILDAVNVYYSFFMAPSVSNAVHHIRIMNSELRNSPGMGVLSNQYTAYNEFINLKVHHNGGNNPLNHGFYIEGDNILIEHCDIHHNAGFGISNYNEYGTQSDNNTYRYNNIHENNSSPGWRSGIGLTRGSGAKVYNNLIWGNSSGISVDYGGIGMQIFNNTIYNNNLGGSKYGISIADGNGAVVRNNIVFQNSGGNIIGSQPGMILSNNLTTDPLFVNSAGSDFHLKSGSPAIDQGVSISGVPDDYDGASRPKGAAYDIGAFEYGGVIPLPSVDVTAPVLSAIAASGISQTGATIGWTTNEAADTQVEYGPTAAYGASTVLNSALTTSHGAVLSGLTAGTPYHYRVKSKDAAGNLATSADAAFTTAAPAAGVLPVPVAGCTTSAGAWANAAVAPQSGLFTAEFDVVPGMANMDGVSGLSNAAAAAFSGLAAAVRFNNAGTIDARNGGAYAAAAPIPYVAGLTYHFRLMVNVPAHTYSAYVKQGADVERLIGGGYAFRAEQSAVATLNNLGLFASPGSLAVCGAAVSAAGAPLDTTAPAISAVAASGVSQTGATIGWTTNEASDTQIEYGPTTAYGASTVLSSALTTSHGAVLSGLTAGTPYHYRVKSKDAAGNLATSADATFTTAAPVLAAGCINSAGAWQNISLPAQSGTFTAEFDAVPGMTNIDGVSGLSNAAAAAFSGLAAAVRFNNAGTIDARNGGAYAAAAPIPYVAGLTYHLRLMVNVPARTYSAYVKQGADAERLIGSNYAFRTEQAAVATLNNVGLVASPGSLAACGAAVTASAAPLDTTAPAISAVAASGMSQTGATIGWTTNEASDTQVEYGPTTAYGASTVLSSALTTSHGAVLSGLTAGTFYHYRVKSKDAAGNLATSADAAFMTAAPTPVVCINSAGAWQNISLPAQSGTFTAEFDAVPGMANIDGVSGLSNAAASDYTGLAAAVRFNNAGTIDARNGGAFAAASAIPYVGGLPYHFRLVVNLPAHTYSAYVKQGANAEQLIGGGYAFRKEQAAAATLNNLGLLVSKGSEQVCGAAVK